MVFIINEDANYSESLSKILWHNIYDCLMFAGLKLSNREDSETKNCIVFHAYMYSTFWYFVQVHVCNHVSLIDTKSCMKIKKKIERENHSLNA